LADDLRAGRIKGTAGQPIDRVICFGIGGSDLGPRLATEALTVSAAAASRQSPSLRFVTNIDPAELDAALHGASPRSTLLLAISKSFTTLETLENLKVALAWLREGAGADAARQQLHAITSQPQRAADFGVERQNILTFADWVGGRYSVWSACGFPVALAHGSGIFNEMLAGAAAMDRHFAQAPLERNLPVLLGLLGLWYVNFHGIRSRAVMPYAQRLRYLPAYLQQLEMESLGKRVDRDGEPVASDTAAIVWGDVGTTAQHSVFQFLHQGSHVCPVDFITCAGFRESTDVRERLLYANALAQADALAFGDAVLAPSVRGKTEHARCPGNRPSGFITVADLGPRSVGALLALHEHRTFVQSVAWNINAFDQWGVEIGKKLLAQRMKGG
jgi:glucose-6-phosphate isomerase